MSTPIDPDPGPSACNLQEFVSAIPGLALDDATKMWIKKWGASIPVPQSLCGTLGQGDLESVSQNISCMTDLYLARASSTHKSYTTYIKRFTAYHRRQEKSYLVTVSSVYDFLTSPAYNDPNNTMFSSALSAHQILRELQQVLLSLPALDLRQTARIQGFIKRKAREHGAKRKREEVDIGQEVLGDTFTEKEYPHILQGYFGIERAQMSLGEQLKHRYSPPFPLLSS
eukprot:jgi/Botrbrau1/13592/Bobra.0307s0011.1